jgi:hypothetical protein
VVHDRSDPNQTQESAQVLKFPPRRRVAPRAPLGRGLAPIGPLAAAQDRDHEPIDDLAQYEEEDAHIDYRHRMLMNVIAVAVVTVLVGAGVWIADTIAEMENAQDCAMQGRQNCAPIEVPASKH